MSQIEAKSKPEASKIDREIGWSPDPLAGAAPPRRRRFLAFLITLAVVALAVGLGRAMWDSYMGAPWTRDGTVRAYVVTMAPEVAGRIVELPVADNQFVHRGDLLMVIDPTDYTIALRLAAATVAQAQANEQNAEVEARRRAELPNLAVSKEEQQTYATTAITAQAKHQQALLTWTRRG
jgi:multidrug resistance efflux pump